MTMATVTLPVVLTTIDCGRCGGTYAINERYREKQAETGGSWTCPYCKTGWGYSGIGENDRLKREVQQERQKRDQAEAAAKEAQRLAMIAQAHEQKAKKETKRLKTRASAGVCPCCKRQFQNMKRHMETKHPELLEGKS